ncbi:hypothetical protein DFH27DRAFT_488371 [Peziza echinospora]|nr:hypothetical protein DFH27DRAFT_488371 [Peziza echinospora]
MLAASASGPLCPDWVFSNNSNVHVANDRRWFSSYTPFPSSAGSIYSQEENLLVARVGTVVLPVRKSPNKTGPNAHGQFALHEVLYCPNALCNIVGNPVLMHGYSVELGGSGSTKSKGWIKDPQGNTVVYFKPKMTLFEIKLSGPPIGPVVGPSVFKDSGSYLINVSWSETEKKCWEIYKETHGQTMPDAAQTAPYTEGEKTWLKTHFRDEYHFLQMYGLSIYKEEDREEGRAMLRAFVADE